MKPRNKDRLMTLGTVLVICSMGVSLPGCATISPQQQYWNSVCTTDTDCEMHERLRTKHIEAPPRWKLWTSIGLGVVVTGYLYAKQQERGGNTIPANSMSTQPVDCSTFSCQ